MNTKPSSQSTSPFTQTFFKRLPLHQRKTKLWASFKAYSALAKTCVVISILVATGSLLTLAMAVATPFAYDAILDSASPNGRLVFLDSMFLIIMLILLPSLLAKYCAFMGIIISLVGLSRFKRGKEQDSKPFVTGLIICGAVWALDIILLMAAALL